ncbi:MAG: hypothetical protein H6741_10450 [Alphaproteobacteria bacterium]|nr:hypothetical protein [Alphaproteobacteria bacterium]
MMPVALLLALCGVAAAEPSPTPAEPSAEASATPSEASPESAPPEPAPATHVVRLIYTGGIPGVTSGSVRFESLDRMSSIDDITLVSVDAFHGTLRQGEWVLRTEDRRIDSVVEVVRGGDLKCGAPEPVWRFDSGRDELMLQTPPTEAQAALLHHRIGHPEPGDRRRCTSASGVQAELIGPRDATIYPQEDLEDWEFVQALDGQLRIGEDTLDFVLTGHPIQEGSRTFALALALQQADPDALYFDTGNFVSGASGARNGELSLVRNLGYAVMERLVPDALAPGESELLPGPETFLAEARAHGLRYIATNWVSEDPRLALPASRTLVLQGPDGPIRIAFIAILDPALQARLPVLGEEGVTITDPVAAAKAEVNRLYASKTPPHAIIAMTSGGPELLSELRVNVRGVDVLVGDPSFATLRVKETAVDLHPLEPTAKGAAVTVSADGLAVLELHIQDDRLTELRVRPEIIRDDLPVDPTVTAGVTRVRAEVLPGLDQPLLPAHPTHPTTPYTQEEWAQVVCEALRWNTGADSVLLGPLPKASRIPGPQTELHVTYQMTSLDLMELHRVPGSKLQGFLDKSYGQVTTSCGATPGAGSAKAWGRGIDPERVYTVLTTRNTRLGGALQPLLASASSAGPWDREPWETLTDAEGQPLTLTQATLDAFRALRDAPPTEGNVVGWLQSTAPGLTPPQWTLRARQVSLRIDDFTGTQNDTYAEVPETWLTSPDSLTLTTASDLSVEYSSLKLAWDARFRSTFTRLSVEEDGDRTIQESADDWRLSTSVTVPAWTFPPKTAFGFRPYSELLFDSEFTPTEAEDGSLNTRQSDLSLTLGLSAKPWKFVNTLRVGGFANQDILLREEKAMEFGGRLELAAAWTLHSGLKVSTTGDLQFFAADTNDDSDLRTRAWGELRLSAPASRFMALSVYAQGLGVTGRGPSHTEPAAAYTLGASIDLHGATTRTLYR